MEQNNHFTWRHYQPEIILLCVRWYLRYALSSRDLEEMMAERGLGVDHTTIFRWVRLRAGGGKAGQTSAQTDHRLLAR